MTRPKVRFCLVFERELLSVPVMRQVLGDTLRGIGVNEDSVADILLAATEACTNVVLHAGQSAPAYTVAATVDTSRGVLVSCSATPRVLPWVECPAAALSASRLAGLPVSGLRRHVRDTFLGTSTCTHLNDTLRSLEDIPALLELAGR